MNVKSRMVKWAVTVCVGITGAAGALDINLSAVDGYWDEPTAWEGGAVPQAIDKAYVEGTGYRRVSITNSVTAVADWLYLGKSGTPTRTGYCVMTGGSLTLGSYLLIGNAANHIGTFTLSDGTVNIANGRIAQAGVGAFIQTGGTLASPYWIVGQNNGGIGTNDQSGGMATFSTANGLYLGSLLGSSGIYKLSGGGVVNVPVTARIGNSGLGRLEQSSGTFNAGSVYLGVSSSGIGTYLMNGGTFSASNLYVGASGSGIVTQSLGSVSVTNFYAPNGAGSGTYILSQGNLSAINVEYIGGTGGGAPGLFVQNGGTNFCGSSYLSVGPYNNAPGTYEMNGGEIQSSLFLIAGVKDTTTSTGTVTLAGGTITVNTEMRVGSYGRGTLLQSGGTMKCPGQFHVGMRAGAIGLYLQSGGEAWLNAVILGTDPGAVSNRYVITGGMATMTNLSVTKDSGREGTFCIVGTNAGVTVVQQLWFAAGGTYEVTLTPGGFTAPGAGTLSLSSLACLNVKVSGLLPYAMDNMEIPILTFGSRNASTFKTVTVETGIEYGKLKSADVVYYNDRIALKVRVSRPPYGTVVTIK